MAKRQKKIVDHTTGQTYHREREDGVDQKNRALPVPRIEHTFHTVGGVSFARVRYIENHAETVVRLPLADWDALDKSRPVEQVWVDAFAKRSER